MPGQVERPVPFTRKAIHQALKSWHSTGRLGDHPLAQLQIVHHRRQSAGYSDTRTGLGAALRDVLRDALEALKPEGDEDDLSEKRRRPHAILTQRYLIGRSPTSITEQLGIARSTYDHEQAGAFDALADLLLHWEQTRTPTAQPPERPLAVPPPFLAPPSSDFALVGRDWLLQDLKRQLIDRGGAVAISGLPGVGKTALAIALAIDPDVLSHFADGVLWAGLGREPNPLAILGTWGAALGISSEELGKLNQPDDWARTIHARIGLRRMLVAIDDAWQIEAALVFRIGGPNCAYLLTTRLPQVALDFAGSQTIRLPELDADDGLALLSQLAPTVTSAEPDAARALVRASGGLPLALTLIGRYLRRESHHGQSRRVQTALKRLRDSGEWLQLTQPDSPLEHQPSLALNVPPSLLAVIALSTDFLDAASQQVLWSLSVFPPKPNSVSEAAALAVCDAPAAALDALVDCGLLEITAAGRYTLHPTVADHASLKLAENPARQRAAFERLVSYYVDYLYALADSGDESLDLEMENSLAALYSAHDLGLRAALVKGANAFWSRVEMRGLYSLAEVHLKRAEQAARAMDDSGGLITVLNNLGQIAQRRGDYSQAEACFREGLSLARSEEDPARTSALLQGLGAVAFSRGDYAQAEACFREGLALAQSAGHTGQISALLTNLGTAVLQRGDEVQAEACFREGLSLARQIEHRARINALLTNLGVIEARRGNYSAAETYFQEGLSLARHSGYRENVIFLLTNLGTLVTERGDHERAEAYFQEGLSLARQMEQPARIGHLLANLGALATNRSDYVLADTYLQEAAALARHIGHRENLVFALTNLGAMGVASGSYAQAAAYLEEALRLAREMGHQRYTSAALNQWGELCLRQGDSQGAQAAFREAAQIARASGAEALASRALEGLNRAATASEN